MAGSGYPLMLVFGFGFALETAYGDDGRRNAQIKADSLGWLFLIGLTTDLISGAMRSHSPNPLLVILDCADEKEGGTNTRSN